MPLSLAHKNLKPFIHKHLASVHFDPWSYYTPGNKLVTVGLPASIIPKRGALPSEAKLIRQNCGQTGWVCQRHNSQNLLRLIAFGQSRGIQFPLRLRHGHPPPAGLRVSQGGAITNGQPTPPGQRTTLHGIQRPVGALFSDNASQ